MEEKITETKEKLSYEELENAAKQLSAQNRQLYTRVQELSMGNAFKRLDYLFKVVEYSDAFSSDFTVSCIEEIEKMMTIKEEEEENENKGE